MSDAAIHAESPPRESFLVDEVANSITHGIGFALSIAALTLMVVVAALKGDARGVVACSIYGTTLALLYLASTLYHSVRSPRMKKIFRVIDHSAIYLLIAGTYTPFTLVSLKGGWGWSLFGVIWGLAVAGIVYKIFFTGRWRGVSVTIYLIMGWISIIAVKPLLANLSMGGVWWLLGGGVAYTVGVIFYVWKTLPFHHAIWHLFVMLGSTCHFFAVMFHVVLRQA